MGFVLDSSLAYKYRQLELGFLFLLSIPSLSLPLFPRSSRQLSSKARHVPSIPHINSPLTSTMRPSNLFTTLAMASLAIAQSTFDVPVPWYVTDLLMYNIRHGTGGT
jgi:hypothetical protein